jgi:hypothetical protein
VLFSSSSVFVFPELRRLTSGRLVARAEKHTCTQHRAMTTPSTDVAASASSLLADSPGHTSPFAPLLTFRVKDAFRHEVGLFPVELASHATIQQVKAHLEKNHPSQAGCASQRLIYRGRALANDERLSEVFDGEGDSDKRVLHLAVRSQATSPTAVASEKTIPAATSSAPPTAAAPALFAPRALKPSAVEEAVPRQPTPPAVLQQRPSPPPMLPAVGMAPVQQTNPYAAMAAFQQQQMLAYQMQHPSYAAAAAASADGFGLRQRHSSAPAPSSLSSAHELALSAYQDSLARYHATLAAMASQYQQQMAQYQMQMQAAAMAYQHHGSFSPASLLAPQSSPAGAAMLYQRHRMPSAAPLSGGLAPSAQPSASPVAPAGSILAALTGASSAAISPPPQQTDAQREAEIRLAVQQYAAAVAAAHAGLPPPAANQPAGAGPAAPNADHAAPAAGAPAGAAAAPNAAAIVPAPAPGRFARYLDLRLLLKFAVLVVLVSQDGDWQRTMVFVVASIVAYLYQIGAFRREGPQAQAAAAGANGAAGAGGNRERFDDEDDDLGDFQGQRGFGGQQVPPREADMAAQQQQAQAGGAAAVVVAPAPQGLVVNVEKFIVGFFASLVPTWQPTAVPAAIAPVPQQQQQPPVVQAAPVMPMGADPAAAAGVREPQPMQ